MESRNMIKEGGETRQREVVVMLIRNEKGEVLFAKRAKNRLYLPGVWSLPSGHIEEGESFKETVIREAQEELGIYVDEPTLMEVIKKPGGDNVKVHLVDIPMHAYRGNPIVNSAEFEEVVWMKMENFYSKFSDEEIGSTLRHLRSRFEKR